MGKRPRLLLTALLLTALSTRGEALPRSLPPEASAVLVRADSLMRARQYGRAFAILDSLEGASRAPADAQTRLRALHAHGVGLALTSNPAAARPLLAAAVPLAQSLRDSVTYAESARWLAYTWIDAGNLRRADSLYRRALPVAVASGARRAEGYIRLGQAYIQLSNGGAQSAIPKYRSVAVHFRKLGDSYGELESFVGLGRCFSELGMWDSASACCRRTATRATALNQPFSAGNALNNLAAIEQYQGDPLIALQGYRAAIECFRRGGVPAAGGTAAVNLAKLLSNLGRPTEAHALLDSVASDARERGLTDLESSIRLARGQLFESQLQLDAARAAYRVALASPDPLPRGEWLLCVSSLARLLGSLDSSSTGLALLESIPDSRLRAERASTGGAKGEGEYLNALSYLLVSEDRPEQALAAANEMLAVYQARSNEAGVIQALSARGFAHARLRQVELARGDLSSAIRLWRRQSHSALGQQWIQTRERVARGVFQLAHEVVLEDPTAGPIDRRVALAFDALQQVKGDADRLRRRRLAPRDTLGSSVLSLARVRQKALRADEVLLDFYVARQWAYALVISREACSVLELGDEQDVLDRVIPFRTLVSTRPSAASAGSESVRRASVALGEWMLGPCAPALRRARRIVVSADGPLSGVPFEALQLPGESEPLGLVHEITYTPSIAGWARARLRAGANPSPTGANRVLALGASRNADNERLPGVLDELHGLGSAIVGVDVRVDQPEDATLRDRGPESAYGVLHVAGHAEVLPEFPWRSGFLLDPRHAESEASWLRADEVVAWKRAPALVVLSGCGTAGGRTLPGQGVEGLTQAFLASGARAVVSSAWDADDASTARIMKYFYEGLARRLPASAALLEARRRIAREAGTEAPYYWSAFLLSGDGLTLPRLRTRSEHLGAGRAPGGTSSPTRPSRLSR